jgi:hypothetical protein
MPEIVDIENKIEDPEAMGTCPLCGNEIHSFEEFLIAIAFGSLSLVHKGCATEDGDEF